MSPLDCGLTDGRQAATSHRVVSHSNYPSRAYVDKTSAWQMASRPPRRAKVKYTRARACYCCESNETLAPSKATRVQ